jgi:hypothetical protein
MLLSSWVAALLLVGCSAPPSPPPFRPVEDNKLLMNAVLDPAADVIWGSVGTIITAESTVERAPATDEEWAAVRNSAVVVTESGNLLMMGNRAKDHDEWMRLSQALIDVGTRTIKAAEARDKQAIFDLGGDIYAVCTNCHSKYALDLGRVTD